MANNWLIEQRIDLRRGVQAPQIWPQALMLRGDNNAHTWRVIILDGGEAAQVSGSVVGYFVRSDGITVAVQGTMNGHVASVTLAQECYAQEGDVRAVMRLTNSDGTKVTLSALILTVRNMLTDSVVDPGAVIPSLDDLLAQIDACETATDAANNAADAANQAAHSASAVESQIGAAEAARVTAEQGRVSAEQARASAEAERVANEDERQQQLTNAINAAEADADRAEAAADAAETLIAMPPLFSNTPPTEAPTLNKLWIDTGVSPTMMRRWRGVDVSTAREYEEMRVGCGKNIADVESPYQVASQPSNAITSTITPGSIQMSASTATSSIWQAWRIWWPAKPGTNYTISAKMESDDDSFTPSLAIYSKTGISGTSWYKSGLTANGSVTVNTNDNDFIGLYLHFTTDAGNSGARMVRYYDIQIEEGSAATEYEPYCDIPFLAMDNSAGQMQSASAELGCRAAQAGTGTPSPDNVRALSGRESVEVRACGKNLLKPPGDATIGGVTYTLQSDGTYLANGTVASMSTLSLYEGVLPAGQYTISGGAGGIQVALAVYDADGVYIRTICTSSNGSAPTGTVTELTGDEAYHRAFIQAASSTVGQTVTDVVLSPQLEAGGMATAFESYIDLGGGEITPSAPLYGLPGAEDTVEISADGDVLVTHRTAMLVLDGTENWTISENTSAGVHRFVMSNITPAPRLTGNNDAAPGYLCSHYNFVSANETWLGSMGVSFASNAANLHICDMDYASVDAWKAYLAAQHAAGTPVTIAYELAEPVTETPAAVDTIVPQLGPLHIFTDADALTATIYGSGWDTISDQTGLLATIAQLAARVAALEQAAVNESTGG